MSLSAHFFREPASCETGSCNSHSVSSGRSRNSPLWRARFLSDSASAPATVQRTALRRVDPSTGTSSASWLNQSEAGGRLGTYTWFGGQGSTLTGHTLRRSTRLVRPFLDL